MVYTGNYMNPYGPGSPFGPKPLKNPVYNQRFLPGQFNLPKSNSIFIGANFGRSNSIYNNPFLMNIDPRSDFQKGMDKFWQIAEGVGFGVGIASDILGMFGFGKDNGQV